MIELQGLTKQFTNGRGIFNVTLTVRPGEVYGFLGPNGAGKSTTIRHLMGFMKPDQGSCQIAGLDCWRDAAAIQKRVGYLPGEISFLEGTNGLQFLNLLAGMRGLKSKERRDELIERFQLDVKSPIRKMSKGMKQKLGIVAAFMHDPDILILDEPTSGLDPLMQQVFIELILEEKNKGKTIFMSSHIFPEIQRTCDRVGMIKDGRLIAEKNIHDLQSEQRRVYEVEFFDLNNANQFIHTGFEIIGHNGQRVIVSIQGNCNAFIRELAKYEVRSLDIHELDLEEIFLEYYERKEK
ncbi:ABC transporter ATP-binding protein [Thermoflavimicrobium dichotomicum]|uniref:ABC-2 type transport system ATP-binding protein n=1 Tax=Thermoflavimicrobium dichotomicum TaxID=46223 RepID=A0A1I3T223_9BACL|nr:ABC transporter ATP-binding protein [Thermoflavimicrobium dichotomicum]SFJ64219.1 ABC-2 type transport system ATP-binding protein [Thermoflavimicrobium dichotomicum]